MRKHLMAVQAGDNRPAVGTDKDHAQELGNHTPGVGKALRALAGLDMPAAKAQPHGLLQGLRASTATRRRRCDMAPP